MELLRKKSQAHMLFNYGYSVYLKKERHIRMSKIESIISVKNFENIIQYKNEGTIVTLFVEATVSEKLVYQNDTPCRFYYQPEYEQMVVDIDWNLSDEVMVNLGLHSKYNTNFQEMISNDNELVVIDKIATIHLKKDCS